MRPHVIVLFLSSIGVGACGGKATTNPADGSLDGSGGSLGSDARLDGSSDGKGGDVPTDSAQADGVVERPAAVDAQGADL
ncbi:MAG: hypothetical protein H7X95_04510, partial [Deltaproteobacteria bacterium]|nr:hypothetical protein [Deltaproteobacteria bacterium]